VLIAQGRKIKKRCLYVSDTRIQKDNPIGQMTVQMAPHIQLTQVHMKRDMLTSCTLKHWGKDKDYVILTYLHIPWRRVLLQKLTGLQLVKKFPAFYGTRRLIIALTRLRHPSLSWASSIQYIYPHPTSRRSILILSTYLSLGLPSGLFPSGFPTQTLYAPSPHPYVPHAQSISFFSILSPAQYWVSSTDGDNDDDIECRNVNDTIKHSCDT
jgi:hypothetical protein